jgi:hypothetical protein
VQHQRERLARFGPDARQDHRKSPSYDGALAGMRNSGALGCFQTFCALDEVPSLRTGMSVDGRPFALRNDRFQVPSRVTPIDCVIQRSNDSDPLAG